VPLTLIGQGESMKSVRALIIDDSSDLIKFVEQSPDTVITLLNGEKILVKEPVNEIIARVVEFRRWTLSRVTDSCLSARPAVAAASASHESEG
jgi:flagellar protein FlbD